jgi:hypothetical protein
LVTASTFGIWNRNGRKCLKNRGFLERNDAQDLENFGEAPFELQFLAEDGHQDINAHGDPHLGLHRVDRVAVERLDPEVLLDPLEEQFDLPATAVKLCDGQGGQFEVVREKD